MKKLANDICDRLGGGPFTPTGSCPGGFTRLPSMGDLRWIRDMLANQMVPDAKASLELLKSLVDKFPAFERETEYVGLRGITGSTPSTTGRSPPPTRGFRPWMTTSR